MNPKYIYTSYLNKVSTKGDFNNEKFIIEIQRRECLWDVYSKCYNLKRVRNKEIKRLAWEEIGRVMYINWDCLNEEEKQKKVEVLSKKWAGIRKYYSDELRRPPDVPAKRRRRVYHHLLSFLDESVLKRRKQRTKEFQSINQRPVDVTSSDSEPGQLSIIEDADEVRRLSQRYDAEVPTKATINNRSYESEIKDVNLWRHLAPTRPVDSKMDANNELIQKNPEIIRLLNETRVPTMINNSMYNPEYTLQPLSTSVSLRPRVDYMAEASERFLLSLLPEIMSLNDQQHLQFRLGIMELLNDIKFKVNPNINNLPLFPNDRFN